MCAKRLQSYLIFCDPMDCRLLCPWDSPGKNTGVGSQALLQGISLTQGSNPRLLHCRRILYLLSPWQSPVWSQSDLLSTHSSHDFFQLPCPLRPLSPREVNQQTHGPTRSQVLVAQGVNEDAVKLDSSAAAKSTDICTLPNAGTSPFLFV